MTNLTYKNNFYFRAFIRTLKMHKIVIYKNAIHALMHDNLLLLPNHLLNAYSIIINVNRIRYQLNDEYLNLITNTFYEECLKLFKLNSESFSINSFKQCMQYSSLITTIKNATNSSLSCIEISQKLLTLLPWNT